MVHNTACTAKNEASARAFKLDQWQVTPSTECHCGATTEKRKIFVASLVAQLLERKKKGSEAAGCLFLSTSCQRLPKTRKRKGEQADGRSGVNI